MDFELVSIGVVRSTVSDRRLMPPGGVPAEVHVFPEYAEGLLLIEENSHIWVIGWFEEADRERLQIVRPTYEPTRRRRGVFGLRSTTRPNSLSLTATKLLAVEDNVLHVDRLDLIDGTPIIDIKRYSPSWDTIFSARSSRDRYLLDKADPARVDELEAEAVRFHGERCPSMLTGARLIQYVSLNWNIMPKDPALHVTIGLTEQTLHLADAIQALTAATFGSGRLRTEPGSPHVIFTYDHRRLTVTPLPLADIEHDQLRQLPFFNLFTVVEE